MATEWQCQYCNLRCELPDDAIQRSGATLLAENASGPRSFSLTLVVCPNRNCRQLHASLSMYALKRDERGVLAPDYAPLQRWQLIPSTNARQLPDFVPEAVRREYEQATGVREISPDASATLSRRCLQNMVRDFWSVREKFLSEELEAVKEKIDPDTWEAIEAVRQTGHIGRRMEKAINLIVDCEPEEPDVLLRLIDYLIDEWYVARRQRQERLNKLKGFRGPEPSASMAPAEPEERLDRERPAPREIDERALTDEVFESKPPRPPAMAPTSYCASARKPSPVPPVIPVRHSAPVPPPSPEPPVIPVEPVHSVPPAPPPASRKVFRIKDKDSE